MSGNGRKLAGVAGFSELEERRAFGDYAYDAVEDPKFRTRDWGMSKYSGTAEPIDYLIDGILPRATPGLIASSGGLGKSYLLLDLCVRVAAGPGQFGQYALGGVIRDRAGQ